MWLRAPGFLFASDAALRPAASASAAVTAPVAVSNHVASAVLDLESRRATPRPPRALEDVVLNRGRD